MIHRVPTLILPRRYARTPAPDTPDLGTITDLSATAGNGQVSLAWTPAANATSHQPQYRASGNGTWNSYGSPLSGSAGSVTVVGLQNGTQYEFRVIASDGVSQTTSNTATATPQVPTGVQPFFSDDFSGGVIHNANGFTWGGNAQGKLSTDIAYVGTHSMKFSFGPQEPGGGSHWWSEQRFTMGRNLKEIWVEFYLYYPDGTEGFSAPYFHKQAAPSNNKFFRLWGGTHSTEDYGRFNKVGMSTQNYGSTQIGFEYTREIWGSGIGFGGQLIPWAHQVTDYLGRWLQIRMHYKHVSAPFAKDAVWQLWVDGVLKINNQNMDQKWDPDIQHWSVGYIMGYDNSGFDQTTHIYLDAFKFYDQDPGW